LAFLVAAAFTADSLRFLAVAFAFLVAAALFAAAVRFRLAAAFLAAALRSVALFMTRSITERQGEPMPFDSMCLSMPRIITVSGMVDGCTGGGSFSNS
jgi:hypothetical protein